MNPLTSVVKAVLLSLLLGPGMGQLYNREFKKGALLIGASLAVLVKLIWSSVQGVLALLPADVATADPEALQKVLDKAYGAASVKDAQHLWVWTVIFSGLWLYGVVDAYLGAEKRRKASGKTNP